MTLKQEPGVAIIGCGMIGRKRAASLGGARLLVCCDTDERRARALASQYSAAALTDWRAAVDHSGVELVIVATTHDRLAEIAAGAAAAGKHVLVEKPCARRPGELDAVEEAAGRSGVQVHAGFNHRFHRAFRKAREIFESGALGPMMFVRARYGHGGRPGYDREWRADAAVSGGGELIDQGVHLIDLARLFLGEFTRIEGYCPTYFWDMQVEDNAFLMLRTAAGQAAFLHASWTEWKNLFSFEVEGRCGKLEIGGLGGSYGVERLAFYRMSEEMGPPETTIWEYPMADDSWEAEFASFVDDIRAGRPTEPGLADARAALEIVERVYRGRKP